MYRWYLKPWAEGDHQQNVLFSSQSIGPLAFPIQRSGRKKETAECTENDQPRRWGRQRQGGVLEGSWRKHIKEEGVMVCERCC